MTEYIDRDAAIALAKDIIVPTKSGHDYRHRCIDPQDLAELPAADVVERKHLPEDVEELVKSLYAFAKDCTDPDMCKDCQFCGFCEDGWTPDAIAHLIETWSATHKAMTERKTGKWNQISPAGIYECSQCGQNVMTSDIEAYKFCHGYGAKMIGGDDDV